MALLISFGTSSQAAITSARAGSIAIAFDVPHSLPPCVTDLFFSDDSMSGSSPTGPTFHPYAMSILFSKSANSRRNYGDILSRL